MLTVCERRILEALERCGEMTCAQIATAANVSLPTARKKELWAKLKGLGLVTERRVSLRGAAEPSRLFKVVPLR